MFYYAMLHIVDAWSVDWVEITQIDAYSGANKLPLSAVFASSTYVNYGKEKLVDSNVNMSATAAGWCSADQPATNQYLIVKASSPFDKIRVYNGGDGAAAYCAKNIRLLTLSATVDPTYNDANWVLQKTDTWPQALAYYDNTVSFSGSAKYFPQCI